MPTEPATRGRGRPRTRPEGIVRRDYYTTDAEQQRLDTAAQAAGCSTQEWVRRTLLAAEKRSRK